MTVQTPADPPRSTVSGYVSLILVVALATFLLVSVIANWELISLHWVESVFTVLSVALCVSFRVRVSARDRSFSFGVSAAILGFSAPSDRVSEVVTIWVLGLLIGLSLADRSVLKAAVSITPLVLMGFLYLSVWNVVADLGGDDIIGVLAATLLYFLAGMVLFSLGALSRGITPKEILRSIIVRRLLQVVLINVLLCLAARYIGRGLDGMIPDLGISLGSVITLTVIGAIFFALAMLVEARTATARLDGVLSAAQDLPWREDQDPFTQIRAYAAKTIVSDRVEIRSFPPRRYIEIGAALQTPSGEDFYLVARRKPGRAPFLEQDVRALSAIAHIGTETMRIRSEALDLQAEANTDPLTNLPNYRAFQIALGKANSAREAGSALAVVYIDLDNFKAINDQHGHESGNQVLRVFADRLRRVVRPSDTVARVGGDEFVIILTDVTSREHAAMVAERIARTISAPISLGDRVLALTISTGIAFSDEIQSDPSTLVEEADIQMYSSRGRQLAGMPTQAPIEANSEIEAEDMVSIVSSAIDERQLSVAYQPVIDNVAGMVIGLEALVRYHHPQLGTLPPSLLVHEARRLGKLDALTEQVMERALADLRRFRELEPTLHAVHVNIEVDQVLESSFVQRIGELQDENPGVVLTLEMTENSLNRASVEVMAELEDLKARGISLALDDFGQAYSTMFAIVQYPFDVLKVDQVLIKELSEVKAQLVIRSMALLVRKLDVQMVVEGVETEEERDQLAKLGVRYMQGYFFGRPISAEAFLDRLRVEGLHSAESSGPMPGLTPSVESAGHPRPE